MTTAPFDPSVALLVTDAHEQVVSASAVLLDGAGDVLPLDLLPGSVLERDETRSPRVTAQLTCAVPDQATIDQLDPRAGVRVRIDAGYRLSSGAFDIHQVADLGLIRRTVRRPDNVLTLDLSSDEARIVESGGWFPLVNARPTLTTYQSGPWWIQWQLQGVVPGLRVVNADPSTDPVELPDTFPDRWDMIADVADQLDADVYDPGDRTFYITPRTYATAVPSARLSVGALGTITRSAASLDRQDWANWVGINYLWTGADGTPHQQIGSAMVTSGPLRVDGPAGWRTYLLTRHDHPTTAAQANRSAATLLRRLLSRSRSLDLDAVAMWWLSPGATVTVQLPTGGQERHIVSSVRFDLARHTMAVTTRLPDTANVIGE